MKTYSENSKPSCENSREIHDDDDNVCDEADKNFWYALKTKFRTLHFIGKAF